MLRVVASTTANTLPLFVQAVGGCTTGEATPTLTGGEAVVIQRNCNSNYGIRLALVGGSTGASSVDFGDKDDVDVGRINYNHVTNRFEVYTNTGLAMVINATTGTDIVGNISTASGRLLIGGSGNPTSSAVAGYPLQIGMNATQGYIQTYSSLPLSLNPLGNNVFVGVGNLGVGVHTPTQKLEVAGNVNISNHGSNLTLGNGQIYWDNPNSRLVIRVS